jgi:hypothetical protein
MSREQGEKVIGEPNSEEVRRRMAAQPLTESEKENLKKAVEEPNDWREQK